MIDDWFGANLSKLDEFAKPSLSDARISSSHLRKRWRFKALYFFFRILFVLEFIDDARSTKIWIANISFFVRNADRTFGSGILFKPAAVLFSRPKRQFLPALYDESYKNEFVYGSVGSLDLRPILKCPLFILRLLPRRTSDAVGPQWRSPEKIIWICRISSWSKWKKFYICACIYILCGEREDVCIMLCIRMQQRIFFWYIRSMVYVGIYSGLFLIRQR